MALNIKPARKVSLNGFAVGWDDCFVIVKAIDGDEARKISAAITDAESKSDEVALGNTLEKFCHANIVGGAILNTGDDGVEHRYEFSKEEVPAVTAALGIAWQIEVLSVATGSDRLKSLNN